MQLQKNIGQIRLEWRMGENGERDGGEKKIERKCAVKYMIIYLEFINSKKIKKNIFLFHSNKIEYLLNQ